MPPSRGTAFPEAGLFGRFGGTKPDIRLRVGMGEEAVWVLTSIGQASKSVGHAAASYHRSFVVSIADLAYRRP